MAKKIKFPLKMKNGAEVRTLDELKENFDLESVLGYFADGRLTTWLADRYYDDLCNAINSLNTNDDGFQEALCKCLGIEYTFNEYYNLSEISRQRERLTYLKSIIADENILKHSNSIALNQEELLAKINEGHKDIYIGKGTFEISLLYENITYHGFENPIVTILATDNVNFKVKNINFENIVFGWDVSKVSDDDEMLIAEKKLRENKWQSVLPILQKYAEMNHPRAILLLERIFFSYDSNDELQKKYSEQGQKLCSVQSFIMNGTDITNNHLAILKYLADKGNLLDMTLYGYTLREFGKKNNNYQTNDIYSYLSAAADGGEPWAMTLLGYCYQYYGFEQNYFKALEWYQKAADAGYAKAYGQLGYLYGEGLIEKKDYIMSLKWYIKAAENNEYWCQGNLGLYYENGFGVDIDYEKALYWYTKAADGGNIWSVKKLTNLIDKLMRDYTYSNINSSVETCIEKAIETQNLKKMRFTYALKGAELGDPEMQYLVAELYYSQSGTDDDSYNDCAYKRAIYWYNKAIEQNYAKAMSGLAGIYEFGCSGPGGCIEQDREKALELYRKGAELGDVASQNSLNRFNEQPIVISAREPSSFGIGGFLKGLFK